MGGPQTYSLDTKYVILFRDTTLEEYRLWDKH